MNAAAPTPPTPPTSPASGPPPATTTLGVVGRPSRADVDARGRIAPQGGAWTIDCRIGAEDRWHDPATEVAGRVRQQRVDGTPVVETTVMAPGGTITQRAYAFAAGDATAVALRITNDTPVPVAVALRVLGRSVAVEGRTIVCEGQLVAVLPRDAGEVRAVEGGVEAVLPLPHTLSHTVVCPLPVPQPTGWFRRRLRGTTRPVPIVPPDAVPDWEQVRNGWELQALRPVRVTLPDARLQAAFDAARCDLLLADTSHADPDLLRGLERWDLAPESGDDSSMFASGAELEQRWPAALIDHWLLTGDRLTVEPLLPIVARAAHRAVRAGTRRLDLTAVARLLADLDQAEAARMLWDDAASLSIDPAGPWQRLTERIGPEASPRVVPPAEAPALAIDVRDLLLVEQLAPPTVGDAPIEAWPVRLAVVPSVPDEWLGQGLEVHDLPTSAGRLSFALRWHGARPALLWELEPAAEVPNPARPVLLTAPGLDRAWSAADLQGEALLAPVEPPGGLPKVYGVEAPEGEAAPDEGGSFT